MCCQSIKIPVRRGRSRSLDRYDRSLSPPYRKSPPASKGRKHSLTPDEGSPRGRGSPSPRNGRLSTERDGSDYSPRGNSRSPVSPRGKSRSPSSPGRDSPTVGKYPSPTEANGRSPSPRDDRSPVDYEYGRSPSP